VAGNVAVYGSGCCVISKATIIQLYGPYLLARF